MGGIAPGALLSEEPAADALVIESVVAPLRPSLEDAQIFLATKCLECSFTELRGDDAFYKETRNSLCCLVVDRNGKRDYRAKGRYWIARQGFAIRVERSGAGRESARRGVLHDRAADLLAERVGREKRPLEVEQIVEGQLLTALLPKRRDAVVSVIDVECSALTRILSVTKVAFLDQRNRKSLRENLRALTAKPVRNRGVVGSGPRIDLFGEQTSQIEIVVVRFESCEDTAIIRRVDDDGHPFEVFCGRAQHRRSANIDLLDDVGWRNVAARRRLLERIKIYNYQIDRRDSMFG